jgi:hypothetical protein
MDYYHHPKAKFNHTYHEQSSLDALIDVKDCDYFLLADNKASKLIRTILPRSISETNADGRDKIHR